MLLPRSGSKQGEDRSRLYSNFARTVASHGHGRGRGNTGTESVRYPEIKSAFLRVIRHRHMNGTGKSYLFIANKPLYIYIYI
jgi:hypothetical protein